MPRRIMIQEKPSKEAFGERLARFRKAAGLSQYALAEELGISQRMVAYYEGETDYPPTHILPAIARLLEVSTDELLGVASKEKRNKDLQLWRRFSKVEKLPPQKRKQIVTVLDALIQEERLGEA
jgi:transcriptional regulator with XRE-family HTH domain